MKILGTALRLLAAGMIAWPMAAFSRASPEGATALPMDQAYQGTTRSPDFAGRDRKYARFRTRIGQAIAAGPNFAGHFAVIEIGCGTGCRHVFVADVVTGRVFDFPFSGGAYDSLGLDYRVTSNVVRAEWVNNDRCASAALTWGGAAFTPPRPRIATYAGRCR